MLIVITILGIVLSPLLVRVLYTSAAGNEYALKLASNLSMIMFSYLLFISLAAIVQAMLNIHNIYVVPAASPILFNICIISIVSVFYFLLPNVFSVDIVYILAIAVLLGGIIQFAYQLPFLKRIGYGVGINISFKDKDIKNMIRLFIPGIFGSSIYQINLLVSTFLAGSIGEGRISAMTYATRLQELVLGVFVVSISTVMLPTLSKSVVEGRFDDVKSSLFYSIRFVALSTIPATIGFALLAEEIVLMLFGSGRFDAESAVLVGTALRYLSVSLFFVASYRIFVQVFFALKDTKTPVYIGLVAFIINAVVGVICIFILKTDIKGISIASVMANSVSFFIVYFIIKKRLSFKNTFLEILKLLPTIIASIIMGCFIYIAKYFFISGGYENFSRLSLSIRVIAMIAASVIVYCIFNIVLKNKDFLFLFNILKDKIRR